MTDKYCEIVRKIRNGEPTLELEQECERIEKTIGANPSDILYSDKTENVISYRQKVLEIENDKDDFLYSLAGNKGETIESLSKKKVVDLMSFAERLVEETERKNMQHG